MENFCLAKSDNEKTIEEHTKDLLNQYDILKNLYIDILKEDEWEILKYAIIFHDLGKINTKFQNKIYKILGKKFLEDINKFEEIPHNFLSHKFINVEYFVKKYGAELTSILRTSVYYHHNRDINFTKEQENAIEQDLLKQLKWIQNFLNMKIDLYLNYGNKYIINPFTAAGAEKIRSKKFILIKGLLNKLDYIASLDKEGVNVEESVWDDNKKCVADYVTNYIEEQFEGNLREVQKYMMENIDENLIVISAVGTGKTEAAVMWLGNSKSFYTLPLKVSINAMYNRIKNVIGYKKAALLHSDVFSTYIDEYKENGDEKNLLKTYYRAKRFSSPFIVTTVDQIFKIIFRYPGYEEILSTFAYSRIIIDEIQMYSPELLAYIIIGLKMITDAGGKFAIITATFPPIIYNIFDMLDIKYKRRDEPFKMHISNRHKIQIHENQNIDVDKVIAEAKNKKVLVIVNTVKSAQKLYDELEGQNVYLLHSNFTKKHRRILEEEIIKFAEENNPGIWISTQIVEASLDIDFDVLFTEMCSIDSLFQRMGRVYRKREYDKENANVYIYDNKNGATGKKKFIIDPEIYNFSLQALLQYNNKNLSEDDKQDIINQVFDPEFNSEIEESNYYKTIVKTIELFRDIVPYCATSDDVKLKFRDIKTLSLMPESIFNKLYSDGTIDTWEEELKSKKSMIEKQKIRDKISQNIVTVSYRNYLNFEENEIIYKKSDIYRTLYKYDFNEETLRGKGLIISQEEAKDDPYC